MNGVVSSARRRVHLVALCVIALGVVGCVEDPPKFRHADYNNVDLETTTTISSEPSTSVYFPPYVPIPNTTVPKAPTTTRAPRTTTTGARRVTTTSTPKTTTSRPPRNTTPTLVRVRGEIAIGGPWGANDVQCSSATSAHPELNGAHATLTDASGATLVVGTIYTGRTIASTSAPTGYMCLVRINLTSVLPGASYSLTVDGHPPVTMTADEITAAGTYMRVTIP